MFEKLSYLELQQYWWIIVSILGALLVFLLFVQGGQTLIYRIGKTKTDRDLLINSIGHKWEFTFTTLVTFGGAFFASFPLFYSTSFGGAYWVWILILFCFIIQTVGYEFRSKSNNFLGTKVYEIFLFLNGLLGTILLGTTVATFFTGSQFEIVTNNSGTISSVWRGSFGGLELAFNFTRYATFINLSLGLAVFLLARILGALYFINTIDDEEIEKRSRCIIKITTIPFLITFIFFLINILIANGFAYDQNGLVYMEPYKYLNNLLAMPLVAGILLTGIVLVLTGIFIGIFKHSFKGIWFAGFGTVLTVFALLLTAGLNNTCYYPAYGEYLQSSLNIENSSSSRYTLIAMSYVSLLIPFVLYYIWYVWRAMNGKKMDKTELENEETVKY
ncbi:MAG: cytochrome d ubiquinol oxidase subunit II [Bacteroidales bacterium]|jgi:cytochrome d ubiquinol oxidase subunit II|nr:cytochrome d ubiquinol oxidase subunit II [Bacteroidales bacterium]